MLDIKIIRENEKEVLKALESRGNDYNLKNIAALDSEKRALLKDVEELKHKRNTASKEIGQLKKDGKDIEDKKEDVRKLGLQIHELDEKIRSIEDDLHNKLLTIPNIPHNSVPVGPNPTHNRIIRTWGEKKSFVFSPKPHWEIGERLNLFDFKRAARLAASGFPLYTGLGARLERALIHFMLDIHTREHGYEEISPPFLCNSAAMTGTGQLPKLEEDMYQLSGDGLYLVPTAEVPLTNIYREEIIDRPLPIYLVAYTPCFRREAGAAGRETRGLIRVHQFDKVELVKFVEPGKSYMELEALVQNAETVLQRLGLHYRVVELCTGDLSFAAAKCYDIELWAPGHNDWLEVSSCSNFEDFQARRAKIRYRNENGNVEFLHTLNGSGVALARLVVALLENYQEADGSIALPEVLWPYMDGIQKIG